MLGFMQSVTVNASSSYDVNIGSGLLENVGAMLKRVIVPQRVAVITDTLVPEEYKVCVNESLVAAGLAPNIITVPQGESAKSISTFEFIVKSLCNGAVSRSDAVLALGGGAVGDCACFAASCYMRGVPFINVPTTLLAMVDSAIGGKSALNIDGKKNIVGAFYQPRLVIEDVDALKTLPQDELRCGMAEMIKAAIVGDDQLFSELLTAQSITPRLIIRAIRVKVALVERDEGDVGDRQLLNLGHTFGHAIESLSGNAIKHGDAVAIGLRIAARLALKLNACPGDVVAKIDRALSAHGLVMACPFDPCALAKAAVGDKKRRGDVITLVLPESIGRCALYPMPMGGFVDIMQGLTDLSW